MAVAFLCAQGALVASPFALAAPIAPAAPPALIAPPASSASEPDDRLPVDPRTAPRQAGVVVVQTPPSSSAAAVQSPSPSSPREGAFRVAQGERLSSAMGRFLQARGWSLEWNDSQDFVLQHGYELDLAALGLPAAVTRILAPYRLSAVLHSPQSQRVVAVGPAGGRFAIDDPEESQ